MALVSKKLLIIRHNTLLEQLGSLRVLQSVLCGIIMDDPHPIVVSPAMLQRQESGPAPFLCQLLRKFRGSSSSHGGQPGEGLVDEISQHPVGPFSIIVPPPPFFPLPGIPHGREPVLVQAFGPAPGVEGLHESVVRGFARPA